MRKKHQTQTYNSPVLRSSHLSRVKVVYNIEESAKHTRLTHYYTTNE